LQKFEEEFMVPRLTPAREKVSCFFMTNCMRALPPSIPRPRLRDQSVAQRSSVQQTKLKPSSTVSSWSTAPGETDDGTGQRHGTSDLSSVTSSSSGSSKFLGSALRWKSFLDINVDECVVLPSTAAVVCLHFYPDLPKQPSVLRLLICN
jgi:hypothetical protein